MRQRSIKYNFIMNAILTLSNFIFPLISFPYVSRVLGPAGTGKVSFAISLVSYFVMFTALGIPTYGIRTCAKVRDNREELSKTVQELVIIQIITGVFAFLAIAVCLIAVPRLQEDRTLYLIASSSIFFTVIGLEWMYKGLEEYTYITVRSLVFKFIALVAMFLLIHKSEDYVIYGGISIFAASASAVMNFCHAHRFVNMRPMGNYNIQRHLKAVLVFFAMACATTIYTHLDTVMLGFMTTDTDVGYYNAAVKIKTILLGFVTSIGAVLLPRASYYVERGEVESFRQITGKALNFVILLAAPLMVYFIYYAQVGIRFLSGPAYGGAVLPMQIIMPTLLLIGITNVMGIQILVPTGREKYVLYSEIGGAVTDLILNAILIPHYQAAGAAFGTLIAEFVVLIIQWYFLRSEIRSAFLSISYWRVFLGVMLGSVASFWVSRLGLSSFPTLLISSVLFFAVYGLTLLVSREKLTTELFQQMIRKLRKT